jgi:TPR repeat protein
MVDQTPRYRAYEPDIDQYDENQTDHEVAPYRFGQSAERDYRRDYSVPLFLSDSDGEPDPSEYIIPSRNDRRLSVSSRILAGVLAISAVAILFALFSSDAVRDIIVNAKASSASFLPAASAAAEQSPVQQAARDTPSKDPARLSSPANQTPVVRTTVAVAPTAVAPTRAEITTAYQSAIQGRAPAAAAPAAAPPAAAAMPPAATAPAAAPPARKLGADELATILNRAKGLLAAGDIPSARLLLERAADAQEPSAALMLAQTYDPDVLGAQDSRSITPDPAMARVWYQKAAQFGSPDAQQRLAQMQQ